MTFCTRSPGIERAPRRTFRSSLISQRCRPRERHLKNQRSSSNSVTKPTLTKRQNGLVSRKCCSPVLRTYTNPEENGHVATSNIPHVMHYAPNVSGEDVGAAFPTPEALRYYSQHGRWPASPSPFVIMPGPHGYHIQFLGVTETAAITKEYEAMLGRLCKINEAWCLPSQDK